MSDTPTSKSASASSSSMPATVDPPPTTWPVLNYRDAPAAIDFLVAALGFRTALVVTADDDPTVVVHAELHWPEGGGVMLGTADRADSEFSQLPTGAASVYVVTDRPDELFARASTAGARVVRELTDHDYGSREFSVADPEGNFWSFGTYRGSPRDADRAG